MKKLEAQKANEPEDWEEARKDSEFAAELPSKLPIKQLDGSVLFGPASTFLFTSFSSYCASSPPAQAVAPKKATKKLAEDEDAPNGTTLPPFLSSFLLPHSPLPPPPLPLPPSPFLTPRGVHGLRQLRGGAACSARARQGDALFVLPE